MGLAPIYRKRSAVVINTLVFILLSLFFLSVLESLEEGVSALDVKGFLSFLKQNKILISFSGLAFITTFFLSSVGPSLFLGFCIVALYKSIIYFTIDFDKLILILSFFYLVLCYNFYQFLKLELEEPFYNPNFPLNIIPSYKNKLIPIKLRKNNLEFEAHLTNWGSNGFFCKLLGNETPKGSVEVEVTMNGHTFYSEGVVVSRVSGGVGVRIRKSLIPEMGWVDFYGIINELGYKPN